MAARCLSAPRHSARHRVAPFRPGSPGQRVSGSVKPVRAILSSALAEARRSKEEVGGLLRVSAPRALGMPVLWPYFEEFAQLHPNLQLEVQFDDHFTDLVTERSDVGFRGGPPPPDGSIARRLLPIQLIICASPEYLARHGAPRTIDALAQRALDLQLAGRADASPETEIRMNFHVELRQLDYSPL